MLKYGMDMRTVRLQHSISMLFMGVSAIVCQLSQVALA